MFQKTISFLFAFPVMNGLHVVDRQCYPKMAPLSGSCVPTSVGVFGEAIVCFCVEDACNRSTQFNHFMPALSFAMMSIVATILFT